MKKKIGVIGAGSWGTALAVTLASKGHQVYIWDLDEVHLRYMAEKRENQKYLPGVVFGEFPKCCFSEREVVEDIDMALFSVPAQHFRKALLGVKEILAEGVPLVNVAKGIEQKTLMTMSQVAKEVAPEWPYVVLSGPSHAEEVGKAMPTTVVVAAEDNSVAEMVQDDFMTGAFRVYTEQDVVGVELGGALKNIIALGAGISDGIGFGDNAKAALMTRGIVEMTRLGIALGARQETFAGLTGVGDLIVTCTSMHSRNRRCGILIGQGMAPDKAIAEIGMVVEGMYTAQAAEELARREGVDMPITKQICNVIRGQVTPEDAVTQLMGRERKHEQG